jgi:hypothetical protein
MTSNGMYNEFLRYFERMNELYNGMSKAWKGSVYSVLSQGGYRYTFIERVIISLLQYGNASSRSFYKTPVSCEPCVDFLRLSETADLLK